MGEAVEDIQLYPVEPSAYEIRLEPCPKRIRPFFAGTPIADSRRVVLMLESGRLPVYYFPLEDVAGHLLIPHHREGTSHRKGRASFFSVAVRDRIAENAAWSYPDPTPSCSDIKGHVAFYWGRMDAWFEEDEEVVGHARNPYHRIDVLESSRHVVVELDGRILAETRRPKLLFETGLPTRYYIPKVDVDMTLLEPSDTVTVCAYKGKATAYWSAQTSNGELVPDVAWSYPAPSPECSKIANMVCFYNEKTDISVDGERQERPRTPWSPKDT